MSQVISIGKMLFKCLYERTLNIVESTLIGVWKLMILFQRNYCL